MGDTITATSDISGSLAYAKITATASTNAKVLKASGGNVYGWTLCDMVSPAAAHGCFLKFYDKATTPVPGTDTPVFSVALISTTTYAAISEVSIDEGIPFVNGIGIAITGAVADNDSTNATANGCNGVIVFK